MMEEDLITCTKVIETRLAIGRLLESQARALSMTSLKPLAFTTLAGKRLLLQAREAILLSPIKHLRQAVCADIAQLVLREDEVVAGIHIAIMLHDRCMTTFLSIDTNTRLCTQPAGKGGIEELHKDLAHITLHPFIEDDTHEPPPLFWPNTEGCYRAILVEELGQMPAIAVLLDALHDRTDLQELALELVAEELVEGKRVLGVMMIGSRHRIPLYTIIVEHLDAIHHLLPCALPLNVEPISIVLLFGSVNTDAHEPTLVVKELTPLWREQSAVGLDAVADALASAIIALQSDCLLIKAERPQHGFAAMPSEKHIRHLLNTYVVVDVLLEKLVRHASLLPFREVLLLQVIAILAP